MPPSNNFGEPIVYSSNATKSKRFFSNRFVKLFIILAIFVFAIIIVNAYLSYSNSPKVVANSFMGSLLSGNATKSYSLTTKSFQNSTNLDKWQASVTSIDSVCSKINTQTGVVQTKTSVRYAYKTTGPNGNCKLSLNLVNASGKWRVEFFSLDSYN